MTYMRLRKVDNRVCAVCGEDDPRVLKEEHHIFGRMNSTETIVLCRNCHDKITSKQNELAPSDRKAGTNQTQKIAYKLRSIGALSIRIGEELIKTSEEVPKYGKGGD